MVSTLPVREFIEGLFIISVTKQGFVKKTDLLSYDNIRQTGMIALKLDEGDELVSCLLGDEKRDVLIATRMGKAIRFANSEIRPMGRTARGVTGIRFSEDDDMVIGLAVVDESGGSILSVCEGGYGKRTPLEEYRVQSRGGKGIYTIKVSERNGPVVGILQVQDQDDLMLVTSAGKVTRFSVSEIGVIGRLTQGVRLMNVDENEKVTSFAKIIRLEGEEI